MYEHLQKREYQNMRFQAAMQGVDLDKETKDNPVTKTSSIKTADDIKRNRGFVPFGNPESYQKMTPEQRQKLTEKMMLSHTHVAKTGGLL